MERSNHDIVNKSLLIVKFMVPDVNPLDVYGKVTQFNNLLVNARY